MYRRKVEENLTLDSQGNPFRMLVFRGSPKSSRKSIRCIDEMRRDEAEELQSSNKKYQFRSFPKVKGRRIKLIVYTDDSAFNFVLLVNFL